MRIEWVRKIFSDGRHNAFTGLAFWQGGYWVTFRSGQSHGGVGRIVLLESSDLETWQETIPADTPLDDRDPKLLATQGALFLYWVAMPPVEDEKGAQTLVSFTQDGKAWSDPEATYLVGYSLWQPKEHGGAFYVAADFDDAPSEAPPEEHGLVELLRSEDGLKWKRVSTITEGNTCTETALVFLPDNSLLAITRQNAALYYPCFSLARPPYEEWRRAAGRPALQGPAAELIHGTVLVSGRVRASEVEATPDPALGPTRTGLLSFDLGGMRLSWQCNFPTQFGEDVSYPGIMPFGEGRALISFYDGKRLGPSDIFLACVEI